jgi:hypothetical protein
MSTKILHIALRTVAWGMTALVALAVDARAQPSTQASASILFFPRVTAFASVDTRIHITNVSNALVRARCFYVPVASAQPEVVEFTLTVPARQPTQWLVSLGRAVDPNDPPCTTQAPLCDGYGIDPGEVPPSPSFAGELLCVQVDASGIPLGGNSLVGHASLRQLDGPEFSYYSAIGFAGSDIAGTTGNLLQLGPQYQSCPDRLLLQHAAGGATDAVAGAGSRVDTDVFLVSCAQDLDLPTLPFVRVQFEATDEFERQYSSAAGFVGGAQFDLGELFPRQVTGSDTLRTELRSIEPLPGSDFAGIIGVAVARHRLPGETGAETRVGLNLTVEGARYSSLLIDTIVLPLAEEGE